ncbi:tetracenpmycin polyketide synthesis 8-o-methyltransferase [Mycobacterium tuberculosis]|nr:tetracenpmycin polyketide synthesis 8-o-methyltransferase [Mycobacterium tuberculosis]CKM15339.1 tetracenpmycin polyketide synthesis 8-o-methyltransferase [Mycobacterium tuberculosis]CKM31443.1 tetracenpmycin polyketide synthesis 8-o-methyltransferase [Mycobacterium tuberculosis]CKM37567.1 tetracenpmycin polyketide synthesis 8-o-methyltransferase [Mycobacterium tuberculosis]CKO48223.1 tetracenpmycin polyketide synthesis 8-o-methyltransferase [Mycobacterium tuberculosis]
MVELSPDRIMAIGGGYGPSKVLLTAVGLGLFTELGDEAIVRGDPACRRLQRGGGL